PFLHLLNKVAKRAVASQLDARDAVERAEKFQQKYWNKLQTLRHQPFAYGSLTVRSLLDTREHCLNEFNFPDPYSKVSPNFCIIQFSLSARFSASSDIEVSCTLTDHNSIWLSGLLLI
ncbi:hypothetical protein AB205_0149240, partial [Aquarana catesbeiana]